MITLAEQKAIAEYLDASLRKVDAMLHEACTLVASGTANGGLIVGS